MNIGGNHLYAGEEVPDEAVDINKVKIDYVLDLWSD